MSDARTALAQAMRAERLGDTRFTWDTLDADAQEDARRRADLILRLLADEGYAITRVGEAKPLPVPPTAKDVYAILAHNPEVERIIRKAGDDWHLVGRNRKDGSEKTLLTMTLPQTDIDVDTVLAGHPDAPKLPAILTRLAMAALIRKLHGEAL